MSTFGKRWSIAELAILESTNDLNELEALLPDRTPGAIKKKKLDGVTSSAPKKWTEEEILQFPTDKVVNKVILAAVSTQLSRNRDQVWKKMKSLGYTWDKDFVVEITEDNPYPDHGKLWTTEELALFPKDKVVNEEILNQVRALFPRRKPTSIWPKMKKEGYIWDVQELPTTNEVISARTPEEEYVLSLAHEMGFSVPQRGQPSLSPTLKNITSHREKIAQDFQLSDDFTSGELYYALGTRITPFPWEMEPIKEVATAYRNRDQASIYAAAKALHNKLEEFLNG
jgi:hypothetical protein